MAPDLRGRINMARMAAAEMAHYELLRTTLEGRGVDVPSGHHPLRAGPEQYHRLHHAQHLAGGAGQDLCRRRDGGRSVPGDRRVAAPEVADVVRAVLAETVHSQFVVAEVVSAVTASGRQRSRLALWSGGCWGRPSPRRSMCWPNDELVDLVLAAGTGPGDRPVRPGAAHA